MEEELIESVSKLIEFMTKNIEILEADDNYCYMRINNKDVQEYESLFLEVCDLLEDYNDEDDDYVE